MERLRKGSEWVECKIFVSVDDQFFLGDTKKATIEISEHHGIFS